MSGQSSDPFGWMSNYPFFRQTTTMQVHIGWHVWATFCGEVDPKVVVGELVAAGWQVGPLDPEGKCTVTSKEGNVCVLALLVGPRKDKSSSDLSKALSEVIKPFHDATPCLSTVVSELGHGTVVWAVFDVTLERK